MNALQAISWDRHCQLLIQSHRYLLRASSSNWLMIALFKARFPPRWLLSGVRSTSSRNTCSGASSASSAHDLDDAWRCPARTLLACAATMAVAMTYTLAEIRFPRANARRCPCQPCTTVISLQPLRTFAQMNYIHPTEITNQSPGEQIKQSTALPNASTPIARCLALANHPSSFPPRRFVPAFPRLLTLVLRVSLPSSRA